MEFQDVVRRRRMVRRFTAEPVSSGAVDRMLRNAVRAPNAGFAQGWSFLVLDNPSDTVRYWAAAAPTTGRRLGRWLDGMRTAPVLVVVLTSRDVYLRRYAEADKRPATDWSVPYWHVDAGMAALLMLLTAADDGLGACFFGIPPEREAAVRSEFAIPAEYAPTGVVAVGYPAAAEAGGSPSRVPRKPLAAVVHRGNW